MVRIPARPAAIGDGSLLTPASVMTLKGLAMEFRDMAHAMEGLAVIAGTSLDFRAQEHLGNAATSLRNAAMYAEKALRQEEGRSL